MLRHIQNERGSRLICYMKYPVNSYATTISMGMFYGKIRIQSFFVQEYHNDPKAFGLGKLVKKQSDERLRCLPFLLHLLDELW